MSKKITYKEEARNLTIIMIKQLIASGEKYEDIMTKTMARSGYSRHTVNRMYLDIKKEIGE